MFRRYTPVFHQADSFCHQLQNRLLMCSIKCHAECFQVDIYCGCTGAYWSAEDTLLLNDNYQSHFIRRTFCVYCLSWWGVQLHAAQSLFNSYLVMILWAFHEIMYPAGALNIASKWIGDEVCSPPLTHRHTYTHTYYAKLFVCLEKGDINAMQLLLLNVTLLNG